MADEQISVGRVAFDVTLNTSTLTAGIAAVSQQINSQISNTLRTSLGGFETSINRLGESFERVSDEMRSSMNAAANGIRQNAEQISRNVNNSLNNTAASVSEVAEKSQNTSNVIGGTLTNAVKKLGAEIASAFAVRQIVRFTRSCVEAAASVKALNAQIEQTFNVLEDNARAAISDVAAQSGILETRLQSAGSQMYAFAKAAGMDSVTALNMMKEALEVTADSAAFYDRSLEDTAESLRSFLKGNYANDAALGISCTETTRNTAANKLYGKSFRELSEAQKQLTLLQMVKDANELSGAMGQAAREADGWENVTGNLKEAWKQLKAAIGAPLLQALIPVIKSITENLQRMTAAATEAAHSLADLFGWDLGSAQTTGSAIMSIADNVAAAEDEAQKEIEETADKKEKSKGSLAKFDNLNVLSLPDSSSGEDDSKKTADSAQQAQDSLEDLKSTAASVDLSGIKNRIQSVMSFFKPLADSVRNNVTASLGAARSGIEGYLSAFGDEVSRYSERIKSSLTQAASQTRNGITNILNEAAKSLERTSGALSQGYTDILGGASVFSLSFATVFSEMLDIASFNFEEWTENNKELLGGFFDGINGNFANLLSTVGGILEDIGSRLTKWWDEVGASAFDNFTAAIGDVIAVLLDFWTSYISPFIDYLIDSFGKLWEEHLGPLWSGILGFISSLWDAIAAIWNGLLRPFYDTFVKRIMVGVIGALKSVWDIVVDVFGAVADIVKNVIRIAKGLLEFITGVFTGDLDKAFDGINDMFSGTVGSIWSAFKGMMNLVIDALNMLWSGFYGILKSIVDGVGDFAGLIGDAFGQNWSFSLPDEVPRIPRLASGGLVRAPTIAVVGDNPNAARDPEVVSPLSKLNGMIEKSSPDNAAILLQILAQQKMIVEEIKRIKDMTVTGEMDGDVVFRGMIKRGNRYKRTHGGRSPI